MYVFYEIEGLLKKDEFRNGLVLELCNTDSDVVHQEFRDVEVPR